MRRPVQSLGGAGGYKGPHPLFPARPTPASSPRLPGAPAGLRDAVAKEKALRGKSGLNGVRPEALIVTPLAPAIG